MGKKKNDMCWRRCRRAAPVALPPPPPPLPAPLVVPPPLAIVRERISRTSCQHHWSFSESSSSSSHGEPEDDDDEASADPAVAEAEDDASSHPSTSSSDDESTTDLLGWHEHDDHDPRATVPVHNIYLDERTLSVRFNTVHQEDRETLSERIVGNYVNHTRASGHVICCLRDVVHGVTLPEDATHLMVTFCNFAGDQFSIPFALERPDDPFPFEDTRWITDCQLDELPQTLVLLHRPDPHGPLLEENLTSKLIHFCWRFFQPGFSYHRPAVWTWLSELSDDPEALLQARYDHDRFACLTLATSELVVYHV